MVGGMCPLKVTTRLLATFSAAAKRSLVFAIMKALGTTEVAVPESGLIVAIFSDWPNNSPPASLLRRWAVSVPP